MTGRSKNSVPRGTSDPIGYLREQGSEVIDIAKSWELKTTDQVYRLQRFSCLPSPKTARLMAQTFGWKSAGEVLDFWMEKRQVPVAKAASR